MAVRAFLTGKDFDAVGDASNDTAGKWKENIDWGYEVFRRIYYASALIIVIYDELVGLCRIGAGCCTTIRV